LGHQTKGNFMIDSRGSKIDTELCVENTGGNRFELVLIASQRCRELRRKHSDGDKHNSVYAPVSSLLEIQDGKIGRDYLHRVK